MSTRILTTDALSGLASLPDESVQCVITSPPYWGLRTYGRDEGMIGFEPTLDAHIANLLSVFREVWRVLRKDGTLWINYGDTYAGSWGNYSPTGTGGQRRKRSERWNRRAYADTKIRPPQANASAHHLKPKDLMLLPSRVAIALQEDGVADHKALSILNQARNEIIDAYEGDIEAIPDRVLAVLDRLDAEREQAAGKSWWLRSEIVWHKPNPMPESVMDRPTNAHEKIFLFSKSLRYFYDSFAVRKPGGDWHGGKFARNGHPRHHYEHRTVPLEEQTTTSNLRNVWTLASQPYRGSHFATFPLSLVEPCIQAGTSEKGRCTSCGAPFRRVVRQNLDNVPTRTVTRRAPVDTAALSKYLRTTREALGLTKHDCDVHLGTNTLYSWFEGRPAGTEAPTPEQYDKLKTLLRLDDRFDEQIYGTVEVEVTAYAAPRAPGVRTFQEHWESSRQDTAAWETACKCDAEVAPCVVLDPFAGAGTVGLLSERLGRDSILIEINPEYAEMARRRVKGDCPLFTEVT